MTTQKLTWLQQFRSSDAYSSISVFVSTLIAFVQNIQIQQ